MTIFKTDVKKIPYFKKKWQEHTKTAIGCLRLLQEGEDAGAAAAIDTPARASPEHR